MFNKLSIRSKLLLAFGLLVLLGVPLPYISFINYQRIINSYDTIINSSFPRMQALLETKNTTTSILDQTANIASVDFSDTQEEGSMGALYKYQLLAKMAELNKWQKMYERHLTINNQFLIITFKALNELKDRIVLSVLDIFELKEKHAPAAQIATKQKEVLFYSEKLASFINSSIINEAELLQFQRKVSRDISEKAIQATILSSILVLLIAIVLTFSLAKRLSKPIIELRDSASKIAQGEPGTQIPITTDDEIGDLAKTLQHMINSLLAANKELKQQQQQLKELSDKLVLTARQAGMADVATSVLHNIGNALNSVNVSAQLINEKVEKSRLENLAKAADLIQEHLDNIGAFFSQDEKGKRLPAFLIKLGRYWKEEQQFLLAETTVLNKSIHHIKDIITLQQSLSGAVGLVQPVNIKDLVEDALMLDINVLQKSNVAINKEYLDLDEILLDKVKVQQILVNLIRNARDALLESPNEPKVLTIKILKEKPQFFQVKIIDNGPGIEPENLAKIFSHGFTTKKHGHGFGLHASAVTAQELDGSLIAESEGLGKGATFILELPYKIAKSQESLS